MSDCLGRWLMKQTKKKTMKNTLNDKKVHRNIIIITLQVTGVHTAAGTTLLLLPQRSPSVSTRSFEATVIAIVIVLPCSAVSND